VVDATSSEGFRVAQKMATAGILTSDEHDADGEDLLRVGVGRHVAEPDRREAAEREVERRDVLGPDRRTAGVVARERIRLLRLLGEVVEPADRLRQVRALVVADGVPDAGEPVRDEDERGHEQQQHGGAVLRVAVELARDAHQPQQARRLEQTDQRRRLSHTTPPSTHHRQWRRQDLLRRAGDKTT